jgi:hypothetical protein
MTMIASRLVGTIDDHPRIIAAILGGIIVFFLLACIFNDVIPICHWLFRCDHGMH